MTAALPDVFLRNGAGDFLGRFELHSLPGGNLDFLAIGGITSRSGGAFLDREDANAGQGNARFPLQAIAERVREYRQKMFGVFLGSRAVGRHRRYKLSQETLFMVLNMLQLRNDGFTGNQPHAHLFSALSQLP